MGDEKIVPRGYRVRLDPTRDQVVEFWRHLGASRHVYNWGLRRREEVYAMNKLPVPHIEYSFNEQCKELTRYKESNPWLYDIDSRTSVSALRCLDRAYRNFRRGTSEFPRYRKRDRHDSFKVHYQNSEIRGRHIKLGKIGWVRLQETGYIPDDIHMKSVTVSVSGGKWYVSIQCDDVVMGECGIGVVGIDLGVRRFATLSDGTVYQMPYPSKLYRKLRRLQRSMERSRLKNGGIVDGVLVRDWSPTKNYVKKKNRFSRIWADVRELRDDFIHKATTDIVGRFEIIVLEDLDIASMLRRDNGGSRELSRRILEQGWSEFRRQIEYKSRWYGAKVIIVGHIMRFGGRLTRFPSSKMCSGCGHIEDALDSQVYYRCSHCGLVLNRDDNASYNLRNIGDIVAMGHADVVDVVSDTTMDLDIVYHDWKVRLRLVDVEDDLGYGTVAVSQPETENACGDGTHVSR